MKTFFLAICSGILAIFSYAQEVSLCSNTRLILLSCNENVNLDILRMHNGILITKDKNKILFSEEMYPTIDGIVFDIPDIIWIIQGYDTMRVDGIPSSLLNYHLKNFEFKKGNWFIKTKPWFQQKVVTESEIFNPTMSIVKVHQRKKIRHVNDKYESFDEMRFFEIDLADTNEVEMMSMDSSFINKYYNTPRSYYDILEWQDYLLFDEDAKQYVEKIQKEYDYYGSGRRVPYIAPYYTKEEYEESISPCRKQK